MLQSEANIELEVMNIDFFITVTREKIEELCKDLFTKVLDPLKRAMSESKLSKSDINVIVLVGGSTRIPMIQRHVSSFSVRRETELCLFTCIVDPPHGSFVR